MHTIIRLTLNIYTFVHWNAQKGDKVDSSPNLSGSNSRKGRRGESEQWERFAFLLYMFLLREP